MQSPITKPPRLKRPKRFAATSHNKISFHLLTIYLHHGGCQSIAREEGLIRKLLLHVPRATDSGKSAPFTDTNNNNRVSADWRRDQSSTPDGMSGEGRKAQSVQPHQGSVEQFRQHVW